MNVKISVKKLFNMEQIIIALKDGQKRYREQIAHMFSEHEDLKEKLNKELSAKEETINYLSDENHALMEKHVQWQRDFDESNHKCKELEQEIEDLKKDRNDWEDAARKAADNL